MTIQEIQFNKLPIIIFTDSHYNLENINKLKSLYPFNLKICLGDITSLWSKNEDYNEHSINFFIENKIPCLLGNHEECICTCQLKRQNYKITNKSLNFIRQLPRGFKINLPNGTHYLCYHNRPNDLWSFTKEHTLFEGEFQKLYPIDNNTVAVLHGHGHKSFVVEYPCIKTKRIQIGALKYKEYAILDENGLHFKSL